MALYLVTKNLRLRALINHDLAFPAHCAIDTGQLDRLSPAMSKDKHALFVLDAEWPCLALGQLLYYLVSIGASGPKIIIVPQPVGMQAAPGLLVRERHIAFLAKPVEFGQLFETALDLGALAALETHMDTAAIEAHLDPAEDRFSEVLVGNSRAMRDIRRIIAKIATTFSKVHISGESGTGKELVARLLHEESHLAKPMVTVNCATLAGPLGAAALFGHTRNAFTGAGEERHGLVRNADGGILFLDEIELMDAATQGLMLRLLDGGTYRQLGSDSLSRTSFKLITASNVALEHLVEQRLFRSDFYYRIDQMTIRIPPLRERIEDIEVLVAHRLKQLGEDRPVADKTMMDLKQAAWPGNVRELFHEIDTLLLFSSNHRELSLDHVPVSTHLLHRKPIYLQKERKETCRTASEQTVGYSS
jgi:two-component system nitrogen regulation response regulator GlnG